jgi:glycosyltransferase involved in cell wall biosynthesis
MMNQQISVVINTYNASKYLARVLETVKNFDEIVVCDMESTDNTVAIANAIFQAVYKGRLTPYNYFTEQEMPIDSVKAVEKMFTRKQIGKIMFTEKWYFSEATLTFTKKVEQVTLGYELIDKSDGELRGFKPAFLVKLNEAK